MTDVDSSPQQPAQGSTRRTPLRAVGRLVDVRIAALQERYRHNTSGGVSDLAALRRAATEEPGADPRVWGLTLAGVPVEAGAGEEPTDAERAVHAAMTLYAVHQQSQPEGMHRPGYGLGRSVRILGRRIDNEDAVRRRFEALGTAATFAELMQHSRGLVRQLRSEAIPLDYGQLADDLVALQSPTGADRVRLRWGRDYHRARPADQTHETTTAPTDPEERA
jgi:CRISPR system Cascade subunit CasB